MAQDTSRSTSAGTAPENTGGHRHFDGEAHLSVRWSPLSAPDGDTNGDAPRLTLTLWLRNTDQADPRAAPDQPVSPAAGPQQVTLKPGAPGVAGHWFDLVPAEARNADPDRGPDAPLLTRQARGLAWLEPTPGDQPTRYVLRGHFSLSAHRYFDGRIATFPVPGHGDDGATGGGDAPGKSGAAGGTASAGGSGEKADTDSGKGSDTASGKSSDTDSGKGPDTDSGKSSDTASGKGSDEASGKGSDADSGGSSGGKAAGKGGGSAKGSGGRGGAARGDGDAKSGGAGSGGRTGGKGSGGTGGQGQ